MNQKIVQELADEIAIYAYQLSISQADIPYVVTPHARPASTKKLSLYVDELTIVGDLVNPGQDIDIVARTLHLQQPTTIDVGGADPTENFLAGQLPTQTKVAFGDPGASGADATSAGASGDLSVAAGSIDLVGVAAASTTVAPLDAWVGTLLSAPAVHQQLTTALAQMPFAFQLDAADMDADLHMNGIFDVAGAVLSGAENMTVGSAAIDSDRDDFVVELAFPSLTLGGTMTITFDGMLMVEATPMTSTPFSASVRLRAGASGSVVSTAIDGQRVSVSDGIQLQLDPEHSAALGPTSHQLLARDLLAAICSHVSSIIAASCTAPRAAVPLTLLAQGATGGRGQDGQSGLGGQPGIAGFTPAGSAPGLVNNGILISYPPEAAGTAGGAGGAAGSAGHSTPGGTAGQIAVTIGSGGIGQILVSAAAGRGGDAAVPGVAGAAGPGGAGSDILVYVAGDPPGTVQDWVGPSGADGAAGSAPTYAGADASDGTLGSSTCNGVALAGSTTIPVDDGALATSVPLALLLICDQGNAVDHLNAQAATDFIPVVARYRWMVAVTEPFVNDADPSHGALTATDLAVRRAMNQSSKLELARIAQGLDYYGEVVNWVPVLSMAALQSRVKDLLDLGQIVETTYNTYVAETSQTVTRLSALDSMLTRLQTKVASDQAEIARLATELTTAEVQIKASLAPIAAQQNRLAVDEFEFKEQFVAYVISQATGCSFLGVLEAIVCIVEFAAEAVVGLGEISALTEAATVTEFASGIVKVIKSAESEIESIRKAIESVQSLLDTDIDLAKIVVDEQKFDEFIGQYLGKFPAADELAAAVHQYFALIQAHNKLALAYTGLAVRQVRLQNDILKSQTQIEAIAARRAQASADAVLPEYTAFMTSAYWNLKAGLLRELFEFNRAYTYWSLIERPFAATDETIANLAVAYEGWAKDVDSFLEQSGPVQPFKQQIDVTAADYPEAFALLARTRTLNVKLDLATLVPKYFSSMTHIVATSLTVALPDIHPTSGALLIELSHSGLASQNSGDPAVAGNLHTFSHARRTIPYKIDYGNPANTAGGVVGDAEQGFPGLSPFTMWQISFTDAGNEWLDVTQIKTVSLTLTGTFLLGV